MSVGDTATLSGGSGFGSSDTVAFALYSGVAPTACNGVAVVSGSGSLSNGLASFSASWTPSSAGTYTVGSRVRDAAGNWSAPQTTTLTVVAAVSPGTHRGLPCRAWPG